MILTGLAILIFVPIHVKTFKYGAFYDVGDGVRDLYRTEAENFSSPLAVAFYVVMMVAGRTSSVARRAELVSVAGLERPALHAAHPENRQGVRCRDCRRVHRHHPLGVPGGRTVMTLDSKIPSGSARRQVGAAEVRKQAGQPGEPPQVRNHHRRHRAGGIVRCRGARRAGLPRQAVLHPRQPAPRAQHRRAGGHQRRQELPE